MAGSRRSWIILPSWIRAASLGTESSEEAFDGSRAQDPVPDLELVLAAVNMDCTVSISFAEDFLM